MKHSQDANELTVPCLDMLAKIRAPLKEDSESGFGVGNSP